MAYFIQGFFFQDREIFEKIFRSETEGGVAIALKNGLCRLMYSGVIYLEHGELVGQMNDHFGKSMLSHVHILSETFEFDKKYEHYDDLIHYKFCRDGQIWVGEYSGDDVGKGISKCVIAEVLIGLFIPD